jgi:hypothetical protein
MKINYLIIIGLVLAALFVAGCTVGPSNTTIPPTSTPTITPVSTPTVDPIIGNWSATMSGATETYSFATDGTWISYTNGSIHKNDPANKWSKIDINKYSIVGPNSSGLISMSDDHTYCTVDILPGLRFVKQ